MISGTKQIDILGDTTFWKEKKKKNVLLQISWHDPLFCVREISTSCGKFTKANQTHILVGRRFWR